MLDSKKSALSTSVIINVIKEITGDTNYTDFIGIITATVNGKLKINQEKIQVYLTNSRPNYALIDIIWEEGGYRNYKDLGLFGRMSTQWQCVIKSKDRTFSIISETYKIDVEY
ncbi:hypothetical protein [Dickeya zeae]|uniref:hypothetical protein n=1 Tax=Dickeya zeae TaxID=204042 RepID=UPI001C62ED4A|nr:hypothetical protein [Dickeya zeae]